MFDPAPPKRKKQAYFKGSRAKPAQKPYEVSNASEEMIIKVLAAAGMASRRGAVELVREGRVAVDGATISSPASRVNTSTARITLDGRPVKPAAAAARYYVLNKPSGYICSNVSTKPGKRAIDLVTEHWQQQQEQHGQQVQQQQGQVKQQEQGQGQERQQRQQQQQRQRRAAAPKASSRQAPPPRLFTVGRLDVATTGLVFVTNDGAWANQVIHPSSGLTKEYVATLTQRPTAAQLRRLAGGTEVEGVQVVPRHVEVLEEAGSSTWRVRVVVAEGRKHEVRALVADAGMELLRLKRIRVGGYRLPRTLPLGACTEISAQEAVRVLQEPEAAW